MRPVRSANTSAATGCWSRRTRSCDGRRLICRRPNCRERLYPLVRELAAAGAPLRVPVAVACRVLKLHRQHYYAWLANPVTDAEYEEAYLANAIFEAHRENPSLATGCCSTRSPTPATSCPI